MDPSKSLAVPVEKTTKPGKRKKYYTSTGAVDERVIAPGDVVLAPEIPATGSDSKYFDKRCESLSIRALVESGAVEYILARPNHPAFVRVLEFVTERSRGKVADIVKNEHVINPAVALPSKNPEQIPDAEFEVLSDGKANSVDASPGSAV
jgi:hypothetical protein